MLHLWWRMEAKLAIVFIDFFVPGGFRGSEASHCFGPGGLRVPPVVADGSKAGHCFHLIFLVQACLRAPPVVADGSKAGHCFQSLAIFSKALSD